MSSKKELSIAYIVGIVCIIVGALSYSVLSAKPPEEPRRIMLTATGGNVLFDHRNHSEAYGLECTGCHHPILAGAGETEACGQCHTKESEYVPALGEKGKFNHDAHSMDYGLSCTDCHHNYTEGDPGGPELCTVCHQAGMGDDVIPGRKEAFHQQCIGCHEELGISPGKTDCNACHVPRKRTDAFHDQCAGCHEEMGAGPAKADCKTCHGY